MSASDSNLDDKTKKKIKKYIRPEDNPFNPAFKTGQILDMIYHQNKKLKKGKTSAEGMFGMTAKLEKFLEKDLDNLNHYENLVEYYKQKI